MYHKNTVWVKYLPSNDKAGGTYNYHCTLTVPYASPRDRPWLCCFHNYKTKYYNNVFVAVHKEPAQLFIPRGGSRKPFYT